MNQYALSDNRPNVSTCQNRITLSLEPEQYTVHQVITRQHSTLRHAPQEPERDGPSRIQTRIVLSTEPERIIVRQTRTQIRSHQCVLPTVLKQVPQVLYSKRRMVLIMRARHNMLAVLCECDGENRICVSLVRPKNVWSAHPGSGSCRPLPGRRETFHQ